MLTRKLPTNVYSYTPRILGIPLRGVFLISSQLALSIVLARITIFLSVALMLLLPVTLYFIRTSDAIAGTGRPSLPMLKRSASRLVSYQLEFHSFEGNLMFTYAGRLSLMSEIGGPNLPLMRASAAKDVMEVVGSTLDNAGLDLDFYSMAFTTGKEPGSGKRPEFRSFVKFSARHPDSFRLEKRMGFLQEIDKFEASLQRAGFNIRRISVSEEVEDIMMLLSS